LLLEPTMANKLSILVVLCFGLLCAFAQEEERLNYYQQLGVSQHATAPDIRRSYLQLASKMLPEKNRGQSEGIRELAAHMFAEASHAYEILSDNTKRERYNSLLKTGQIEYSESDQPQGYQFKDPMEVFNAAQQIEEANKEASTTTLLITAAIAVVGGAAIYVVYGNQNQKKKDEKKKQMVDKVKTSVQQREEKQTKLQAQKNQLKQEQEKAKHVKVEAEPVQNSAFEEEEEEFVDEEESSEPSQTEEGAEEGSEKKQTKTRARDRSSKKNDAPASEFYCAACRKAFKSTAQWENHERSKKHKDEIKRLNL